MATTQPGTGKMVGAQVRRVEDPRVLLGKSRYVNDIQMPGMLEIAFVRSLHAHARLQGLDVSAALEYPGSECGVDW
jgi:carbon-monoxide dehydrogenase large subunit